jgi:hypothetical protein
LTGDLIADHFLSLIHGGVVGFDAEHAQGCLSAEAEQVRDRSPFDGEAAGRALNHMDILLKLASGKYSINWASIEVPVIQIAHGRLVLVLHLKKMQCLSSSFGLVSPT